MLVIKNRGSRNQVPSTIRM